MVALLSTTTAQDFHYTQYFNAPLNVNPALAGAFNGSYRINGIYRDQYRGSALEVFSGFSLNVDAPIIKGLRKQDWVGIGLRMEQATAGAAGQKINAYGLNVAYHLSLDKKQTQILSLGVQYATGGYAYTKGLDDNVYASGILSTVRLSDEAINHQNGGNAGAGGQGGGTGTTFDGGSLSDAMIGVLYNAKNPKSGADLKIGVSVEGILSPNQGFVGEDRKTIGINAFSAYEFVINRRTSLTSGLYYYAVNRASALNINSIMNYKIKPGDEMTLHVGAGLRNIRAGLIFLGGTYKGIRVGVGYDLDIGGSVLATNTHKSIELSVAYLGKIYKKPKPKPIIYCPRL